MFVPHCNQKPYVPSGSIRELFTFATRKDMAYVIIGCLAKAGYGTLAILILLVFANFFSPTTDFFQQGILLFWKMCCFAGGAFVLEGLDTYCIEVAKHRQVAEWRKAYVKAILRQDVGWYDISNPQELAGKMGEAIVKIEKGLSVATSNIFLCCGQFVAGCVLGIYYKWDVALIALGVALITFVPAMITQMRAVATK